MTRSLNAVLRNNESLEDQVVCLMNGAGLSPAEKLEVCQAVERRITSFKGVPGLSEEAFFDDWNAVYKLEAFTLEELCGTYGYDRSVVEEWLKNLAAPVSHRRRMLIKNALTKGSQKLESPCRKKFGFVAVLQLTRDRRPRALCRFFFAILRIYVKYSNVRDN